MKFSAVVCSCAVDLHVIEQQI